MEQFRAKTLDPTKVIPQLKHRLVEMSYSQSTIDRLDSVWRNFTQYWDSDPSLEFTEQTLQQFISLRYGCTMGNKDKAHNVQRAMNMLWDFVWYNQVFKQSTLTITQFRPDYRDVFEGFLSYLQDSGYSAGSLKTFRCRLLQFEAFLLSNGIRDIKDLTTEHIQRYTKTLDRNTPKTMARKLRLLKKFLAYVYEHQLIGEPLSLTIPTIRVPRNIHLPTVFTKEEVASLLSVVDRSNPLGKRDYAILALASGLGLRVSDILGLTFNQIDWSRKLLLIVQQKTGKRLELPLLEEVGWAIIDYLQHGRPQSDCANVFIKHCAPYDALTSSMYRTVQKYLHMAGIKCPVGKPSGIHSLRHSLASSMLAEKTPLPVISGTLGHSDPHSTETYLSIDLHQLRECALEVDV